MDSRDPMRFLPLARLRRLRGEMLWGAQTGNPTRKRVSEVARGIRTLPIKVPR
jgi:hypothetical protein